MLKEKFWLTSQFAIKHLHPLPKFALRIISFLKLMSVQERMGYTQFLFNSYDSQRNHVELVILLTLRVLPSPAHTAYFSFPYAFFIVFKVFIFFVLAPCWVCMLCYGLMFRLVVSGPVSLSMSHLYAALILGSVCSIWAKFSNGDNNRGRPGERRRWVLPVYRVSCMLLQASQLHLPAYPSVYPHFSHRVFHQ